MQTQVPYAQADAAKYPEQIAVAIARDENGVYNPIALGWCMCTSITPPMLAVSIGTARYSCGVFRFADVFTVAFPSAQQADEVLFYGTKSGRDMKKIETFGGKTSPAVSVDGLLMDDAVANFECRKTGELVTGDHVIFVGEVVASHVNTGPCDRLFTVQKGYRFAGLKQGTEHYKS